MEVQQIIEKITGIDKEVETLTAERQKLMGELKNATPPDWDWITVREAANILDCSLPFLYHRINKGTLSTRHNGSKILLKKSEITRL